MMNFNRLSPTKKELFVKEYLKLLNKWKKEFRLSTKEKILVIISLLYKKWILNKKKLEMFKRSIVERKKLKKFVKNKAEMEIINTWIKMDEIVVKEFPRLFEVDFLKKKYNKYCKEFRNKPYFEKGRELLLIQTKLFSIYKKLNKGTIEKADYQEKLRKLTKEYDLHQNKNPEIVLLGILTYLMSRNERLTGTKVAFSYFFLRRYKSSIRDTILLTKQMRTKVKKANDKLDIIKKDMEDLSKILTR